ncbi:DinB family protein [Lacinutrix sp. C3R15]|uniref:DinB family protein n=1 Tax=Flavobacteriaceae TaxID=49546 RepID=UPI001C097B2B|nr:MULTISPECIES: DinB family protein [Flavobacteriaceae]MBU2940940.1 DinB family protein [Lacinutrix sp. C3R15]MDO6624259.1 DinB family protein [Oceanihabitans sp. 1_MG-2023]
MNWAFDINLKNRNVLHSLIENLSLEQLNKKPKGFNNTIIWNIAHTIVTQQLLVYKLSGLPSILTDEMIEMYRKGTKTERDVTQKEVDEIKGLLFSTITKTQEDYTNKVFKTYTEYTVSTKSTLTNVEEAVAFNNFHEGIHLGYILALKRAL